MSCKNTVFQRDNKVFKANSLSADSCFESVSWSALTKSTIKIIFCILRIAFCSFTIYVFMTEIIKF